MIAKKLCILIALIVGGSSVACRAEVQVRSEEELQVESLVGLKHVWLLIDGRILLGEFDDKQIRKPIESKLRQCGIKTLSRVDCAMTEDAPILIVRAFRGHCPSIFPPESSYQRHIYINVILKQDVYLARTPRKKIFYVETWKAFHVDDLYVGKGPADIKKHIDTGIQRFINDYRAANNKKVTCRNCSRVIGNLEQAWAFEGNIVCEECYKLLTHQLKGDK